LGNHAHSPHTGSSGTVWGFLMSYPEPMNDDRDEADDVSLEDVDEALMYAALTSPRGVAWSDWVDQLLDARNHLVKSSTDSMAR
jgi:hypothetical protein